jgi:hypothetical protein
MHRILGPLLVVLSFAGCIDMFQQHFAAEERSSAPSIAFADDEADDRIAVMETPSGQSWSAFNISGDRPAYVRLNDGTIRPFTTTHAAVVGMDPVAAGDKLDFCAGEAGTLQVRVLHTPSNTILHTFTFSTMASHTWCR